MPTRRIKKAQQYNPPVRRVHRRTKGEGMQCRNEMCVTFAVFGGANPGHGLIRIRRAGSRSVERAAWLWPLPLAGMVAARVYGLLLRAGVECDRSPHWEGFHARRLG